MFDKRLTQLCPESKKYIAGNIILQWLELALNTVMIITVAKTISKLYYKEWTMNDLTVPIIIIIGAAMDAANVPSLTRMIYLMLILGFLGWAGVARLVRGQILSLREQEFMTATEACGIRPSRRIFRHLIPNVIPQLIVTMTMSLGSTIITEATLSFLGLGVKFPFASWGNIINDVNDTYVLTNYWFIWIPAGVCLVATVLAFNLVGDGLRDAFDPKMKR